MEIIKNYVIFEEYGESSLVRQCKYAEAIISLENELRQKSAEAKEDILGYVMVIEKLAWLEVLVGKLSEAKKHLKKVLKERKKTFRENHFDVLRLYAGISFIVKRLGKKAEADFLYEKIRQIFFKMNKYDFLYFGIFIAISFRELSKTNEAKSILEKLLEKRNALLSDNSDSLYIKVEMGHTLLESGKHSEAIKCYEEILRVLNDVSEMNYELYSLCKMGLSRSYMNVGKLSEAKIQLEDLLRENCILFGNCNPIRLKILSLTALCCVKQGNFGEAKNLLEDVLKGQVEKYGKDSYYTNETSIAIGKILILIGNFTEANDFLEEPLGVVAMAFGNSNQLYLKALRLKSILKFTMGKYGEAAVVLEEVLSKQIEVVGVHHADYLESKKMLAHVYNNSFKFEDALHTLEDILRLQSPKLGASHRECLITKMWIASTYNRMKKFGESETLLNEVLERLKVKLGEDHNDTVCAMGLLAVSMFGLGRHGEIASIFETFLRKIKFSVSEYELIKTIALSLKEMEEYENCKRVMEKMMKDAMEILGDDHPIFLHFQLIRAECLFKSCKSAQENEIFVKDLEKL